MSEDPLAAFEPFIDSVNQSFVKANFNPPYSADDPPIFEESSNKQSNKQSTIKQSKSAKQSSKQSNKQSIKSESSSKPNEQLIKSASITSSSSRCKGNSCHQCKTTKESDQLYFCTNRTDQPNQPIILNQSRRCCRKKYCLACMTRWYKSLLRTGEPGIDPSVNQSVNVTIDGWLCPSCLGACVCAACDRKKDKQVSKQSNEQSKQSNKATKQLFDQPLNYPFDLPFTYITSQSMNLSMNSTMTQKRGRTFTPTLSGTNSPIPKTIKTEGLSFEQSINQSITRLHKQLSQSTNQSNHIQSINQTINRAPITPSVKLESINELCMPPMYGPRQITDPSIKTPTLNRQQMVSRSVSANPPFMSPLMNHSAPRSWPTDTLSALTAYYQSVTQAANQAPIDQSAALNLFYESQRASAQRQQFIQNVKRSNRPIEHSNESRVNVAGKHIHDQEFASVHKPPINQSDSHVSEQLVNRKTQKQYVSHRSNSISSLSSGEQSISSDVFTNTRAVNRTQTPPLTEFSSGSSEVSTPKTYGQPSNESISHSINDMGDMHLTHKSRYESFTRAPDHTSSPIDRSHYPPLHTCNVQNTSAQSINPSIPTIGQLFESFSALVTPLCSLPASPKHQSHTTADHAVSSLDSDPFHPSSLYQAGLDCSVNLSMTQPINQFETEDLCGDWSAHGPSSTSHEWIFSNQ